MRFQGSAQLSMPWLQTCLLLVAALTGAQAMYCGDRNCYDVLKLKESATKSEIVNSYRKLAREYHPDKNRGRAKEAEKEFAAIAHAYDILRNDVSRRDYDYALRHPEEFAYNHAKYFYTHFYSKRIKFNPILVLLVALGAWSAFDYTARMMCYKQRIQSYKETQEYRIRLKQFKEEKVAEMEQQGLIKRKMNGKRTRKELDSINVDDKELEDQIQVHGAYRKPKVSELAIVQVWLLPYLMYTSIAWHIRWIQRYTLGKEEYTDEDKEYIVRGIINMSKETWDAYDPKKKDKLMKMELWMPENEKKFRERQRAAAIQYTDDFDD